MRVGHDPLEGVRADGIIVTGAHRDRLSAAFRPVIERALEHLDSPDGAPSLYVYGSVATGTAQPGSSDVDLVTIGLQAGTARRLARRLTAAFSHLCRGVEIGAAQPADYEGASDEAYGNRVFLRHYCVHLAGPDPRNGLPDCPADRNAARGFNGDIGLQAQRWRDALADSSEPALLARRIARKTLFAVTGLVSMHEGSWTTDRIAAAQRFGAIRPRLAPALDTLVAWASDSAARPSRTDIHGMLEGAVADLIVEFDNRIGLWRPAAARTTV